MFLFQYVILWYNRLYCANLTLLYIYVCLFHKTLLNSKCFTSVLLFQHRSMRLHHNSLIFNFQLDIAHVLHLQGTTQVENLSFPLILLTGPAYFVEKSNINCESLIPIGWIDKTNNRIGKVPSACAAQNL